MANNSFKYKLGEFILKRKLKAHNRQRAVYSLNTARPIGIVYNATHQDTFETTRQFVKHLFDIDKKVAALGFVDHKEIVDFYTARRGFNFFCRKNVNWYGRPSNPAVDEFIAKDFDILIDLSMDDNFSIRYITSLSKAKFKVGRFTDKADLYDFMVDISKKRELGFFIQQVKHYLTIINNQ